MPVTTVGLDADDTLWHNETLFRLSQKRFAELLADHAEEPVMMDRLAQVERRNLRLYGYGVKGFTLSMLETAMELCDGSAPPHIVREILAAGREMLVHPVETLPGVADTVAELSTRYRLILITKGDLMDQERKLAASRLGDYFSGVEIVSEKDRATYSTIFSRHGVVPASAAMVGNSMRSDVLPAIEAGAWGIHIPYPITWAHELAEAPEGHPRFVSLSRFDEVPAWLNAAQT
ncbi:HAD family hydrolase [Brevundimonas guildfordensis]|uniref:HAD family hydrolase n=1 Tax=Brevundimonas guildfordensis TaxID=2762241 RepID=A0ABR8R1T5_9CAUL|nr:HAD family hydrolase [Brevundimonas guildfordensis]MBD7941733.1 HAD family hydrolase [Brevundimonas guildfordensis]